MRGYLLDTNHLTFAINPVSHLRERLLQARRAGFRIGTCVPVLCELEVGIRQASRPDASYRALHHLLREMKLWPIDEGLAPLYADVYGEPRRQGRVLSQVDIMLAALVRLMKLTLLTSDRDFEALPDIPTENWIVDNNGATR